MPKGLFTVFHDSDLSPPPASRSTTAKPKVRRKPGLGGGLGGGLEGTGRVGKENYDPFAPGTGSAKSGKGCGVSKGEKQHASLLPPKVVAPRLASSNRPSATTDVSISANGVCTGTLRTRVMPDLPPLPRSFRSHHNPYPSIPRSKPTSPSTEEVDESALMGMLYPNRFESFGTPSSAKDSGYALSEASRSELEVDGQEMGEMRMGFDEVDSDTLARNLTESPLAEVRPSFSPSTHALTTLHRSHKRTQASVDSPSTLPPPIPPPLPLSPTLPSPSATTNP